MENGEKEGKKPKLECVELLLRGQAGRKGREGGPWCSGCPHHGTGLCMGMQEALTPNHPWSQALAVAPTSRVSNSPCLLLVKEKGQR